MIAMGYMYCPKDRKPLFYSGDYGHADSANDPRPDRLQCAQTGKGGHFWEWSINEREADGCWTLREIKAADVDPT